MSPRPHVVPFLALPSPLGQGGDVALARVVEVAWGVEAVVEVAWRSSMWVVVDGILGGR